MTDDMWGTGDYRAVAEKVTSIGDVLVSRAAIEPGLEVLDVACGTGNATIPAAKLGARVTGLDLSPRLVAIARQRGAEAGVDVEWLEGDAQSLPRRIRGVGDSLTRDESGEAQRSTGFRRNCYLLSIAMCCASAPLCAPATRTVSTPASYDAETASLETCAGSLNDRRNDP